MRWFSRRSPDPSELESSRRLESLMPLISRGDREAFAELFDATSPEVRAELARRFTDPREVSRVCGAVYVEVWWLAGCWTGHDGDARDWIAGILQRRAGDRATVTRPSGAFLPSSQERELAELLRRGEELTGQLQGALDSRIVIEQAKGAIAQARRISVDEAFEAMRSYARSGNRRLGEVAHMVVDDSSVIPRFFPS